MGGRRDETAGCLVAGNVAGDDICKSAACRVCGDDDAAADDGQGKSIWNSCQRARNIVGARRRGRGGEGLPQREEEAGASIFLHTSPSINRTLEYILCAFTTRTATDIAIAGEF